MAEHGFQILRFRLSRISQIDPHGADAFPKYHTDTRVPR